MFRNILIVSSLGLAFTVGALVPRHWSENNAHASSESTPPPLKELGNASQKFRDVAKHIGPSVVSIKVTKSNRGPRMRRTEGKREFRDFPFPQLFRDFEPDFGFEMPEQNQMASGSGIIIDKRGYVVTNNHVVEGASKVTVTLADDDTELTAKVVGTDPKTDIAVLKIQNKQDFPAAEWGDSDSAEVGDWVVAIGNPFSLSHSVTEGIISAKRPNAGGLIGNGYQYDLIQTSAAINPGNSGGALATMDGKVVGVNTAIFTVNGGNLGIGFAIPANLAKSIVAGLMEHGKIDRGWLGVEIQNVSKAMKSRLGISGGVLVRTVSPGSPASAAGIKAGDVVVEKDGTALKDASSLSRVIGSDTPGKTVQLKLLGQNKTYRTVKVKLGNYQSPEIADDSDEEGPKSAPSKFGMGVAPSRDGKDFIVRSLERGSFADSAGIRPGDIIKEMNGKAIASESELRRALQSSSINLLVARNGEEIFFELSVE